MTVLTARGGEDERDYAHGVVRQLLEPRLRAASPDERQLLLAGAAGLAASVVGPGLPHPAPLTGDAFAVMHGLYWMVANIAVKPTLIVIDDVHWADQPSIRFVGFLARRLEGLPVVIVLAARRGERDSSDVLLDQLISEPGTRQLRLSPLTPGAVGCFVATRLGQRPEARFVASGHRATGGNPFLLEELLRVFQADGVAPTAGAADAVGEMGLDSVARSTLRRLSSLPAAATPLAQAVAVLGEHAWLARAARLLARTSPGRRQDGTVGDAAAGR